MEHIEYWTADDGARFDDEYECELYELSKKWGDMSQHLTILDDELCLMSLGSIGHEGWQNKVEYYIIYDSIGYDFLAACKDYTGIPHPHKPDNVIYPMMIKYADGTFIDVKQACEKYNLMYKELTKAQKEE